MQTPLRPTAVSFKLMTTNTFYVKQTGRSRLNNRASTPYTCPLPLIRRPLRRMHRSTSAAA